MQCAQGLSAGRKDQVPVCGNAHKLARQCGPLLHWQAVSALPTRDPLPPLPSFETLAVMIREESIGGSSAKRG
eukprot:2556579-Amphidinium_carterae.1